MDCQTVVMPTLGGAPRRSGGKQAGSDIPPGVLPGPPDLSGGENGQATFSAAGR
jgi:hypothetical protein